MFSENHLSESKSWSLWNARKIIGNRPFAGRWRGRNIFELPNIQVIYFGLCSAKKSTYYRFSIFVRQSVSSICMCHIFKIMKKKIWWMFIVQLSVLQITTVFFMSSYFHLLPAPPVGRMDFHQFFRLSVPQSTLPATRR